MPGMGRKQSRPAFASHVQFLARAERRLLAHSVWVRGGWFWPLADAQKVRFPADSSMARCPRLPRTTRIDSGTTFGRPRLRHDRSYGPSLIGLTLDRGRLCLADRRCDSANLRSAPSRLAGPAFACLAWSGGSLRPVRRLPTGVSSLGLGRAHRPGRPRHVRLLPHNPATTPSTAAPSTANKRGGKAALGLRILP